MAFECNQSISKNKIQRVCTNRDKTFNVCNAERKELTFKILTVYHTHFCRRLFAVKAWIAR